MYEKVISTRIDSYGKKIFVYLRRPQSNVELNFVYETVVRLS